MESRAMQVQQVGRVGDLGERLTRGAVAGFVSGLVFLVATMGYVTTDDKPAIAPLVDISTVFHGTETPPTDPAQIQMDAVVGLVTHAGLSALYGIVFGLLVFPIARVPLLVVAGVGYGLLLYVVNFQIFGRTLFPWFTDPMGPDQGFEIFIHAVFGLLLVPFFLRTLRPLS
jgi:hypothetical protein